MKFFLSYEFCFSLQETKWSTLKTKSENEQKLLEDIIADLREFRESGHQLDTWLAQKEKMVAVLGPLAIDPVVIQNQIGQVKVIHSPLLFTYKLF